MARIVIIDDDPSILGLMVQVCRQMGHEVEARGSGREGMAVVGEVRPELLLVDLKIPDMNGLEVIQECRREYPGTAVVMVTGFASVETAVEAMKLGAFDYLTKPFELDDLRRTVERALTQGREAGRAVVAEPVGVVAAGAGLPVPIIGESRAVQEIMKVAARVADNESPLLLEGEFGVGKQMVARAVHQMSRRGSAPFKVLQCSGLPAELLEQELFGSGGGRSIFTRAEGGMVLLEEINALPLRLQAQLDGWLEELQNRRMAGSGELDFRLAATTTVPLEQLVREGKFRGDLCYRISVIQISLPPLRHRREDIPLLTEHFLEVLARRGGVAKLEVDKYAMQLLSEYGWLGNIGELRHAIERACAFAEDGRIRPVDLPSKISQKVEVSEDESGRIRQVLPIGTKLTEFIKKQERVFIRETLRYNEGSREKTASMLGVSIATLYRKMGLKLERDKLLG